MIPSAGLRYLDQLRIGLDELQWWQETQHRDAREALLGRMLHHGLVLDVRPDGKPSDAWALLDQGNGQIKLGRRKIEFPGVLAASRYVPSVAVDGNGAAFGYPGDDDDFDPGDVIPDDGQWYTVLARKADSVFEPGTLQVFVGSNVVTGTGTKFLRYAGRTMDGFGRGTRIRIDAADTGAGNAGTYEVDTVVSDTSLTLVSNIAGGNESGIPYRVAGDFLGAAPADPDCHLNRTVEVVVVARIREPADKTRVVLGDVRRVGVALEIIDRRTRQVFALRSEPFWGVQLRAGLQIDTSPAGSPWTTPVVYQRTVAAAGGATCCALVEVHERPGRCVLVNDNGAAVEARRFELDREFAAAAVVVDAAGAQPTAVSVPYNDRVHAFYVRTGVLYMRTSTDYGATWGAESTVWNPTAVDPLDTVAHPHALLARNHRLFVVAEYYDDSAGVTQARLVYSDDYGSTWNTNGNAGYDVSAVGDGNVARPYLAQAPDDVLWCAVEHVGTLLLRPYWTGNTLGTTGWGYTADVAQTITISTPHDPALWIAPNGQIAILATEWDAINRQRISVHLVEAWRAGSGGGPDELKAAWMNPVLAVSGPIAVAVERANPYVMQARSGHLVLVYIDTDTNVPTIQQVDVLLTPRSPQSGDVRTDL